MILADWLLLACTLVLGMLGGVLSTWRLHLHLYRLEDQVTLLEGIVTREVKARAGQARWTKPEKDEKLVRELLATQVQPAGPVRRYNWWENFTPTNRAGGTS